MMKKSILKVLIRRVGLIIILLILGIDVTFAEWSGEPWNNNWMIKHPYIYTGTLLLLPVGWLFFCSIIGIGLEN